jgi:CBS domain-containing protein
MNKLLVRDWMTRKPITIHPQQTLPQAHKLMKSRGVRRLPVVDGGELVGIVTFGDIREAQPSDATTLSIHEMNYLLSLLTVDSIMTEDPITVREDSPIADAARLMLDHKIGGIPVMDEDGRLTGIITESDLCRLVVETFEAVAA